MILIIIQQIYGKIQPRKANPTGTQILRYRIRGLYFGAGAAPSPAPVFK